MSSKPSPFVVPQVGYHKWLQTTRRAEHARRKRLGLEKLKPIICSNQHSELPKLPFPFLVDDKTIFTISPKYTSGYANRFRNKVIVNRVVS
jgi:hypothetical protein